MPRPFRLVAMVAALAGTAACNREGGADTARLIDPPADVLAQRAPDTVRVRFETTKGAFVVHAYRDWAPHGVDRFHALVQLGYYDGVRFFRVIDGFMAQFGIHGDPRVNAVWRNSQIPVDTVVVSNRRGTVTFAMRGDGPHTRTTQLFINYADNIALDGMGFAPIGYVVEGMDVVDNLYGGYGEGAPRGAGPDQTRMQEEGNRYLERFFPRLDHIQRATLVR